MRTMGRWVHLKTGKEYVMVGIALEEETLRPVVVYFPFGKPYSIWTRPADDFFDGRFLMLPEKDQVRRERKLDKDEQEERLKATLRPPQPPVPGKPYDPMAPMEVNWDALKGDEFLNISTGEDRTDDGVAQRVEDAQGTALKIGDFVRLENEYCEEKKVWPETNPLTPVPIFDITDDGAVILEREMGKVGFMPNLLRFVKRP